MENVRNPELVDVLDVFKREIFFSLNCHAIGTIQSFDAASQTCKATINYAKTVVQTAVNGKNQSVPKAYPILVNVPVINLFGGPSGITFPIAKGDTCMILFNDKDMDNWFISGDVNAETVSKRSHSLSDGVALVGIRSKRNALTNYDPTKSVWFHGSAKVSLSAEKLKIENAIGSLMPTLEAIINDLKNLPVTYLTTTPTNPIAPGPATPALIANITANVTKLKGLLE